MLIYVHLLFDAHACTISQNPCANSFQCYLAAYYTASREDQGVREVIPHIGPIPIIIPLKLFLEGIDFLMDNVTLRVTWKLRGGGKVQKHVGISL